MVLITKLNCTQTSSFLEDKLWEGEEKIVIAIDCGTTSTGVAYSYLYPNGRVYVQRILHWPGQDPQKGEAKIPTLVWYDQKGQARAFGAEACSMDVRTQAEQEDWQLAEHFKLHLHPSDLRAKHNIIVQPLPRGIPIEQIYADFFGYLYRNTRAFFQNREVDGENVWNRLEDRIEFVIASPNGWGAWEFAMLRKAAVLGGLMPSSHSSWRIHFVSEAEASVHYVLSYGDLQGRLKVGDNLVVCDAGGSTADTTHYHVVNTTPMLKLKETQASACVQAGGIFVDQAAASYFEKLLSSAGIHGPELMAYTRAAVESFEAGPKRTFEDADQDDFYVEFGDHRFTNTSIGVRRGRKSIDSSKIENLFSPLVKQIKDSVKEQMQGHTTQYVLLVGGFGDSPYLRKRFKESTALRSSEIVLANNPTAKAVAEGAAAWFIQHAVTARAPRYSYGAEVYRDYIRLNPRHYGRRTHDGNRVRDVWREVITKGQVVEEDQELLHEAYGVFSTENITGQIIGTTFYVNTNRVSKTPLYFFRDRQGDLIPGVHEACIVQADISSAAGALVKKVNEQGRIYWYLPCQIAIKFGQTELSAQVVWKDADGKERRGDAVVIPEKF